MKGMASVQPSAPPAVGTSRFNRARLTWLLIPVTIMMCFVATAAVAVIEHGSRRSSVFFGIDVPSADPALVDAAAVDSGASPTVLNIFVKLDSRSFTVDTLEEMSERHLMPMVSLEPWSVESTWTGGGLPQYRLSQLSAGRYDAELTRIARTIAAFGKPVYLRFAHEMNGDWYPWAEGVNGNQPGDYVRAWRHVHDLVKAISPRAKLLWSPNAGTRLKSLPKLFPGDRYVDAVGMTAYGHGASAMDTLTDTYHALLALSKRPVILAEVGADGAAKASWIAGFGGFVSSASRVVGFVWFNTSTETTKATGDYRFDDSPANTAAFAAMLAKLRLAGPR